MEKEKEKAIIELLKQKKPYSEIEQQLHVSSRDIAHTKKKYEEQQNKIESQSEVQSEVVPFDSNVTEQHKDQKGEPNTDNRFHATFIFFHPYHNGSTI